MADPFADPTPRSSAFGSADSFRGRLLIIEPTKLEHDIPKSKAADAKRGDRITATVSVVDGLGPVYAYANRNKTEKELSGDVHRGVWFNQDQIVEGLMTPDGKALRPMVLCRIDTLNPGTWAGEGNPWVISAVSEEDKQTARNYLANRTVSAASAPSQPAQSKNPFG